MSRTEPYHKKAYKTYKALHKNNQVPTPNTNMFLPELRGINEADRILSSHSLVEESVLRVELWRD